MSVTDLTLTPKTEIALLWKTIISHKWKSIAERQTYAYLHNCMTKTLCNCFHVAMNVTNMLVK